MYISYLNRKDVLLYYKIKEDMKLHLHFLIEFQINIFGRNITL